MTTHQIAARWIRPWLLALIALCIGVARSAQAQGITIESPREGVALSPSIWGQPQGIVASSSGAPKVQVLLQRASGGSWLSWNGSGWQSATALLPADYDAASRRWAWAQDMVRPSSTSLPPGSYRLQAITFAANGSVLSRAERHFSIEIPPTRRAVPPNDAYQQAIAISGASGRVVGSNVDATSDALPGLSSFGRPNVWWKWTSSSRQAQLVTFDTISSNFNTILAIDRFTPSNSVQRIGIDDNGAGGYVSRLRFEALPNTTYYIGVEGDNRGVGGIPGNGNVVLNWRTDYRPANDAFQNAISISGSSGRVTGTNVDATGDGLPGQTSYGRPNVWWKWTASSATSQTEVTFDTIGSNFNTLLTVDRLSSASTSVRIGSDDNSAGGVVSRLRFTPQANGVYYIGVEGNGAVGNVVLNWSQALGPAIHTIRGRVVDTTGRGVTGARVYLIPGRSYTPLIFAQEGVAVSSALVSADGSYVFANLRAGDYTLVPFKATHSFLPHTTLVNAPLASGRTVNFTLASLDTSNPTVQIGAMESRLVGERHLTHFVSGTFADASGSNVTPSGTWFIAYTVYRLRSDAASQNLAPGKRGVEAIFSRKAAGFVSNNGLTPNTGDHVYYAEIMPGNRWRTAFDQAILDALGTGTYRVAVTAMDNAFNQHRNAATSTNPNAPAGRTSVYSHFSVRPAKLGVTRTLPLSAPHGQVFAYTITVSNSGDLPLSDVAVRQTINTDKTVLQGNLITPRPSAISGADVIWSLGTLPAHSSRILQLKVKASDNNPFGSNIAAGNLSVTSGTGNVLLSRDQVNIESSTWLIGGFLNALRSVGDAVGRTLSYTFTSSARDGRAKDDLNRVNRGSYVTRVVGLDLLQFNNGSLLMPIGAGQVIAIGPRVSGGNIISGGAGNIISGGAGNIISNDGASAQSVLSAFFANPASILAHGASGIVSGGGGNLIVLGGGNIISGGAGNLIGQDGAGLINNASGQFSNLAVRLIGQDGAGLIGQDGAGVIGQDGAGFTRLNGLGAINASGTSLLAGRGNIVSGGAGNIISGGAGNIVAGGAGN